MGDVTYIRRAKTQKQSVSSWPDETDNQEYYMSADRVIYLWAYYRWIKPDRGRAEALLEILERQRGPENWIAVRVPYWAYSASDLIDEEACQDAIGEALQALVKGE